MLFNTLEYLLFLPAVVLLHYCLPHRFRWLLLLGASYGFYACWRWEYTFLILFSTAIDYWLGRSMEKKASKAERKPLLYLTLAVNIGLLVGFKY